MSRRQLLEAAVGRHVIDRLVTAGHLHCLHRGVYAVGHRALAPLGAATAALLAVGGDVLLSHLTAALLWRLLTGESSLIDVTVLARRAAHRRGVIVHRTAALEARDRRWLHGLPLTSPARTLLDIADLPDLSDLRLERAVGEALTQRLVTLGQLDDVLDRADGRHGAPRLGALVARTRESGAARTRSDAEAALLDLIRAAGLPAPKVNARVAGYEVDFLWPAQRLVLELDGFRYHSTPLAADRDHRKTQVLTAAGLTVMRASPRQTDREPVALVARIAMSLGAADAPGR